MAGTQGRKLSFFSYSFRGDFSGFELWSVIVTVPLLFGMIGLWGPYVVFVEDAAAAVPCGVFVTELFSYSLSPTSQIPPPINANKTMTDQREAAGCFTPNVS
jgi:hypothetical protein